MSQIQKIIAMLQYLIFIHVYNIKFYLLNIVTIIIFTSNYTINELLYAHLNIKSEYKLIYFEEKYSAGLYAFICSILTI